MDLIIGLIIGVVLGTCIGIFIISLCICASDNSKCRDCPYYKGEKSNESKD